MVVATIQWLPRVCVICRPLDAIECPGLLVRSSVDVNPWMSLNCFLSNACSKLMCLSFNSSPVAMIIRSSWSKLILFTDTQSDCSVFSSETVSSSLTVIATSLWEDCLSASMCSFGRLSKIGRCSQISFHLQISMYKGLPNLFVIDLLTLTCCLWFRTLLYHFDAEIENRLPRFSLVHDRQWYQRQSSQQLHMDRLDCLPHTDKTVHVIT